MTTNKNDSAFPYMEGQTRGLTKREYFALQALQGMLVGYPGQDELPSAEVEINGATPELESQIRNDIASLPQALRSSVKKINITPDIGIPDARGEPAGASATHENGKPLFITFYEGSKNYNYDTLVHEAAHQLAAKTWGTSTPPKEYKQLFKAEGGVTSYGSASVTEDFAEAVKLHTTGRLQAISPGKDAYVSKLLTDNH